MPAAETEYEPGRRALGADDDAASDKDEKSEKASKKKKREPRIPGFELPREDTLREQYEALKEEWRDRHELDDEVEQRINRLRNGNAAGPNGEENGLKAVKIQLGILGTLQNEFVGVLGSESPRVEALADGMGPPANKRAAEQEDWDVGWFNDVRGDDKLNLLDSDQLTYGRGIGYVAWCREYWEGMPEWDGKADSASSYNKDAASFVGDRPQPIIWEYVPATQAMYEDDLWSDRYGPRVCVSWEMRKLSQIALEYPESAAAGEWAEKKRAADLAQQQAKDEYRMFVIYANRKYQVYASAKGLTADIDEKLTSTLATSAVVMDHLKDVHFLCEPFEHHARGNPFVIHKGHTTGHPNKRYAVRGVFDNVLPLIDVLDDVIAQAATGIRRYSRAVPMVTRVPVMVEGVAKIFGLDENGSPRDIEWTPDSVANFLPGETPGWWQPPLDQYKAAFELHNILSEYVQRDTLAPSTWGSGAQTGSGFHLITTIQASERKLKPLFNRKGRALEEVFNRVHALAAHIGNKYLKDGITLWRAADEENDSGSIVPTQGLVTLKPRQAEKARVRVKLTAKLDSARAANMQLGIQIAQAVTNNFLDLDKDWIVTEFFDQQNPERHRRAAIIQRFLAHPQLFNWLADTVLKEAQMKVRDEEAAAVQQLAGMDPAQVLAYTPASLQAVMQERGMLPAPPGVAGVPSAAVPADPTGAGLASGSAPADMLSPYTGGGNAGQLGPSPASAPVGPVPRMLQGAASYGSPASMAMSGA